ncbi:Multiple RNA-binding domain-containing protein 1 [Savitreella phatthalungensis]
MMSTRIIIKDLPPHLTQNSFANHFSSASAGRDGLLPTDAKLQLTREGRSRRFGFVGYASEAMARRAAIYWNRTFVGTTRVKAELARTIAEDAEIKERQEVMSSAADESSEAIVGVNRKRKRDESNATAAFENPERERKFQEFLRLHEPRSKTKTFLNDDENDLDQAPLGMAGSYRQATHEAYEKPDTGDEDGVNRAAASGDTQDTAAASGGTQDTVRVDEHTLRDPRMPRPISEDADDEDWLRSRTSRLLEEGGPEDVADLGSRSTAQTASHNAGNVTGVLQQDDVDADVVTDKVLESRRLFCRNLDFKVSESDLHNLFSRFGTVQDTHTPVDGHSGQPLGTAFIMFDRGEDALKALRALDGTAFHGRLLHILPAAPPLTAPGPAVPASRGPVGSRRKEERRRGAAKERFAWNTLFLNQDAVLQQVADRFGVAKSALIEADRSDAAVTMALAEASVLRQIKQWFSSHGVDLSSFGNGRERDDSIILFKNLPAATDEKKVRDTVEQVGGEIVHCLVPPQGGLALVQVKTKPMGKSVFAKLAYRKFPGADAIIYLEKGPSGVLNSQAVAQPAKLEDDTPQLTRTDDQETDPSALTTVFVKNLSWQTRDDDLTKAMETLSGFRNATVKTKPDPKVPGGRLSMGFGFAEFATQEDASRAIRALQGFKLDGHALELKPSQGQTIASRKKAVAAAQSRVGKRSSPKVVVKNLPFETTRQDVQRLFSAHGKLKACRLPKKVDAHLRGFAFLEFVSKGEAEHAVEALQGTHLLGRRLVIEYARHEDGADAAVDRLVTATAQKQVALARRNDRTKSRADRVNLDQDPEAE